MPLDESRARALLTREADGERPATNALDSMAVRMPLVDRIALDDLASDVATEMQQQQRREKR